MFNFIGIYCRHMLYITIFGLFPVIIHGWHIILENQLCTLYVNIQLLFSTSNYSYLIFFLSLICLRISSISTILLRSSKANRFRGLGIVLPCTSSNLLTWLASILITLYYKTYIWLYKLLASLELLFERTNSHLNSKNNTYFSEILPDDNFGESFDHFLFRLSICHILYYLQLKVAYFFWCESSWFC
jgi:hypothetical protein